MLTFSLGATNFGPPKTWRGTRLKPATAPAVVAGNFRRVKGLVDGPDGWIGEFIGGCRCHKETSPHAPSSAKVKYARSEREERLGLNWPAGQRTSRPFGQQTLSLEFQKPQMPQADPVRNRAESRTALLWPAPGANGHVQSKLSLADGHRWVSGQQHATFMRLQSKLSNQEFPWSDFTSALLFPTKTLPAYPTYTRRRSEFSIHSR